MKKLHAALIGAILLGGVAACAPLPTLNALSPGSGLRSGSALAYGEHVRHKLDVYSPEDSGAGAPVVVFFLGGNWSKGEREEYAFVGRALASRGMVAVIPDVRLHPEVAYPDFLDDAARALAWTVREIARYGGDPTRLFVMGHSSGAYNAAMLALDPQWLARQGMQPAALRGWIGLAGPYDFLPIENPTTKPVFHFPNTPPESQPIRHARAGTAPALLIAANSDKLVDPVRNTRAMAAALRAREVAVQDLYFDKVSHATLVASLAAPLRFLAPTLDSVEQFVKSDGGRIAAPARAK
jgi:acetyl esterase/lipase